MDKNKFSIGEFYKLIWENRTSTILIFVITISVISIIPHFLTKRYKSSGILNVYSSYFKNPLVRDIMPELHAQDEIRYNVFALIKNSLNDKFLNELGEEFKLFKYPMGTPKQQDELLNLRNKKFDLITLGPQTFKISFIHSDPKITKDVSKKTVEHIIRTLVQNRGDTIKELMIAMKKRIEILNLANEASSSPIVSKSPEILKEELLKVERSINALKEEYSSQHPIVKNLEEKRRILNKWVKEKDILPSEEERIPILGENSQNAVNEILKDFLTKYNYLRVAYDVESKGPPDYLSISQYPSIPSSPFFPNNIIFYAIGLVLASLLGLMNLLVRQLLKETTETIAKKLEEQLGAKFLGTMPHFHDNLVKSVEIKPKEKDDPIKWN